MRIERVESTRPLRWRRGKARPVSRLWMPVTDDWIGTGDDRLWAASGQLEDDLRSWLDGPRT